MKRLYKILYSVALIAFVPSLSFADVTTGKADIMSGETLKVGEKLFRLAGIDAPEIGQMCINKSGKEFNCGRIAATAMMDLTAGAKVSCVSVGNPQKTPILAHCDVDGYDLAEGMVYTGWAMPDPLTGTALVPYKDQAMKSKNGLWAGQFQMPWDWREKRSQ